MYLAMNKNKPLAKSNDAAMAVLLQKTLAIKPLMMAMNERGLLADDRRYLQTRIEQIEDEIREKVAQLEGNPTWLDSKFRLRKTEMMAQELVKEKAA